MKKKIAFSYFAKDDFVLYFPYRKEPGGTGFYQDYIVSWLLSSITLLNHELGSYGFIKNKAMTDISNHSQQQRTHTYQRWLPSAILFGLLLINAILLFIPGHPLDQGKKIFFWQRYNEYLYQLQCLILALVPIAAILVGSFFFKRVHNLSLVAIVFMVVPCLFVNYLSLFVSSYVYPIGTVNFDGHIYHLVLYAKFDDPSEYHLGKCDWSGYWCVFHEIYSFFGIDPGSPQITINDDGNLIIVKMGDDIVYTYDGQAGECTENITLGICDESPP